MEVLSWSCASSPKGGENFYLKGEKPLHFPANGCALYYRESMPGNLAQWQAKTLPQDWRDVVFGAMSNLSDDSS